MVTGSKVKVNFGTLCIRPCGHSADYSFSPIFFKLHMSVVDHERRDPIDFESRGQRSRSTLATLCIRPCGNNTDYSLSSINFKLHMSDVDDEGRNPIDFGSQGQRSSSILPTCEEMPRFALSSSVLKSGQQSYSYDKKYVTILIRQVKHIADDLFHHLLRIFLFSAFIENTEFGTFRIFNMYAPALVDVIP